MNAMKNEMADAIREVTARVQRAIDDGYRSKRIDADDLVEVLLAIADELDPDGGAPPRRDEADDDRVDPDDACPGCGERRKDFLLWIPPYAEAVRCQTCGRRYTPGRPGQ